MLTKKDIAIIEELIERKLEEKLETKLAELEKRLEKRLEEKLEQKLEEKLEQKLEQKLKALRDEIFEKIDAFLGLYRKVDEEQTLLSGRVSEHSDQLEDHEQRISTLEDQQFSRN